MNDSKLPQKLKPYKKGQCPPVPPLLCQWLIPDNDGTAPGATVTSEAPRDFAELLRTRVLFCLNNPHLKNEAVENSLQIPLHFLSTEETSEISSKLALPEIFVLGPAKPTFPGWLGRADTLFFGSKGKCCQLPAFKPAALLLSMKSARQDIVMGREKGRKQGMGLVQKPAR